MTTTRVDRGFYGSRLRVQRLLRGLSQSDLARQAGVAASMISRMERDDRYPSDDVVAALADALAVDPRLFGERIFFEARSEEVHFRHRARTPAAARYEALGHSTLLAELIDYFDANLRLPPVKLPTSPSRLSMQNIEEYAAKTRRALGLPDDRPLASVIETLEAAGIPSS